MPDADLGQTEFQNGASVKKHSNRGCVWKITQYLVVLFLFLLAPSRDFFGSIRKYYFFKRRKAGSQNANRLFLEESMALQGL